MLTPEHFAVFGKYKDASAHAFSNDIVSPEDKDRYADIHTSLKDAAEFGVSFDSGLKFWNSRFYRDGGVQGQRPKDLWSAIINKESDPLGKYPQVYLIANELGLEIGFSVAIHESDYYNEDIKIRNRAIVPVLYKMLPEADSPIIRTLSDGLATSGGNWFFGVKSRQGLKGDFNTLAELVNHIKSGDASAKGGGSVYKIISPSQAVEPAFRLDDEVRKMMELFGPLMRSLTPSTNDSEFLQSQHTLFDEYAEVIAYDPSDSAEGKTYKMRKMANRLGQRKFREKLLEAYKGTCAVTGCSETNVLQAAHISPYDGPKTNHVQNGMLLRADIHNLFDLGLICIDPISHEVLVSPRVQDLKYRALNGSLARLPEKKHHRPSMVSLKTQYEFYMK